MTYRERRERKAERLREWADGRDASAQAASDAAHAATEHIPFGQPILVGHHSEKRHRADIARADRNWQRSAEDSTKAQDMRSRAENIERAADAAIYDDDPDAVERLREKIAALEARREAMKRANADFRREHKAELAKLSAYDRHQAMPHPSYSLQNLGGNLSRLRKRLARLEQPDNGRLMVTRYDGECRRCDGTIAVGEQVRYFKRTREIEHPTCPTEED